VTVLQKAIGCGITLDVIEYAPSLMLSFCYQGMGLDLLLDKSVTLTRVTTEVYGMCQPLTAPSLINAANRFIAIDDKLLL